MRRSPQIPRLATDEQEAIGHLRPCHYHRFGPIICTVAFLLCDRQNSTLTSCHKWRHTEQCTFVWSWSGRRILTIECVYSGYDFGYFIKLLTALSLPTTEDAFFNVLKTWFPTSYDIKTMMRASKLLKGGLQDVADDLGVRIFLPIDTP